MSCSGIIYLAKIILAGKLSLEENAGIPSSNVLNRSHLHHYFYVVLRPKPLGTESLHMLNGQFTCRTEKSCSFKADPLLTPSTHMKEGLCEGGPYAKASPEYLPKAERCMDKIYSINQVAA